ncbi:FaeA-like protein [Salmonella enterica subsp. enterica serovar Typhi]|nr:FaeA-like protein [Salmonella enterica subsp. enterica serovar Typhi]
MCYLEAWGNILIGKMMRDVYKEIVDFMNYQMNTKGVESFRTRKIADAIGLTIYQARVYLEALQSLGIVEKINAGKGVSGVWRLH